MSFDVHGDLEYQAWDLAEKIVKRFKGYGVGLRIKDKDIKILKDRFRFGIKLLSGTRINEIKRYAKYVRMSLKLSLLEVLEEDTAIFFIVAEEVKRNYSFLRFLKNQSLADKWKRMKLPYLVGFNVMNEPVIIDLVASNHILIGGGSGYGKTTALWVLILSLVLLKSAAKVNLLIIDIGANDLTPFEGIPHLSHTVIGDAETAVRALVALAEEMERRKNLEISNPSEFGLLPRIVAVIDEFQSLITGIGDKQMLKLLIETISNLLRRGRHAKIFLVIAAHNPTTQNMKIDLGPIVARMSFRVRKRNYSETILGESGAEHLRSRGEMLLITDDLQHIQGAYISLSELKRVLQNVKLRSFPNPDGKVRKFEITEGDLQRIGSGIDDDLGNKPATTKRTIDEKLLARIVMWSLKDETISCNLVCDTFEVGWKRAKGFLEKLYRWEIAGELYEKRPRAILPVCIEDLSPNVIDFLEHHGYTLDNIQEAFESRERIQEDTEECVKDHSEDREEGDAE